MKVQKHQVGKILEYIPPVLPTSVFGVPGMVAPAATEIATEYGPEIIENFKRGAGNVYNTTVDFLKNAPFLRNIPGVQNIPGGTTGRALRELNKKAEEKINGATKNPKKQIGSPSPWTRIFQQGGNMDSSDKKEQEEFAQFLVQKSGAKTQKELEAFVKELGEEGMKKLYTEFKSKKKQKAKHGAKLQYVEHLKKGMKINKNCFGKKLFEKGGKNCKCKK